MPKRHAPEHQEDDRGDDDDVEEEIEQEGIHEWRIGGPEVKPRDD
jgi:hypothetical protein